MAGKPFFDNVNNIIVTSVIRFKPAYIERKGDELLRMIYFILKKNESANTMMVILGTVQMKN